MAERPAGNLADFALRAAIAVGVAALIAAVLLLVWSAANIVLLVFAGILFAVFLRALAGLLHRYLRLPHGWALGLVILAVLAVLTAIAWAYGPSIAKGVDDLVNQLIEAFKNLQQMLEQYDWGRQALQRLTQAESALPGALSRIAGFFSTALGALSALLVILFLGIYFSIRPELYVGGLVRLVPPARRPRAREVMQALGTTLTWWLVGRLSSMAVVGVLTWAGLLLLGIPLALTLATVAALLTFIPYIGPILAAVPAILIGYAQGAQAALYAALLYTGIQLVESYLVTPLIQQRTVSMPPALLLTVQLLMGVLFGFLGVLLATPFAVVVLVLVNMLYIHDVLEAPRPEA